MLSSNLPAAPDFEKSPRAEEHRQTPKPQPLPTWVRSFCCLAPSVALIGVAIAATIGSNIAWQTYASLTYLCGKIFPAVLRFPSGGEKQ